MDSGLTFGQWLKRRRRGLGLTQRALGQQLGYSSETIRKVEADELRPSRQLAERLAQALDLAPDEWAHFIRFARDEPGPIAGPSLSTQTVSLTAPAPPRHNLPAPLTSFIGRQREIDQVRQRLGPSRLVTLIGAGGMGKSRLALEAARGLVGDYSHGVWLVELAGLADAALVPQAVAQVWGVRQGAGQLVLAGLANYVREKSLLLVLDNCEHLIAACAELAQSLLQAGPGVHLLATSREALRVSGEHVYMVPPLSLPEARQAVEVERVRDFEAVRLFVERAAAALPGFGLERGNVVPVVAVCRGLDGMPLALELAAARVPVLRVEQIASRLSDTFRLLNRGSRTGLPRHQALRATIDWSYALLSEEERALLRRLSVFAGGWTLELAEALNGDEAHASAATLDLLSGLAHKSMIVVRRQPGEPARYRLLETIRAYAAEQLRAADEADDAHRRHLQVIALLAEEAEPHLRQADQAEWLGRLRDELDNVRAALAWSLDSGQEPVWGARLAAATWRFWTLFGYLPEGVRWLERALAALQPALIDARPDMLAVQARLLVRFACMLMWSAQTERAAAVVEEGLAACRQYGHGEDLAFGLIIKGTTTAQLGDSDEGERCLEEAIRVAQAGGLKWFEASAHFFLIWLARSRYDLEAAERHAHICLAMCRDLGEYLGVADTLLNLGGIALARGHYAEAVSLFEENLETLRALHAPNILVGALINCGDVAQQIGRFAAARSYLKEALALVLDQADPAVTLNVFMTVASLARREGDYDRAETMLQQAQDWASDRFDHARLSSAFGMVARRCGDHSRAVELHRTGLRVLREDQGYKPSMVITLRDLALVWAAAGRPADAAALLAAVEEHAAGLAQPVPPVDRPDYERGLALVREALGETAFAAAWAQGTKLSLEQAVALALDEQPVTSEAGSA